MSKEKNREEFESRFPLPDGMRWCSTSQQYTGHKEFWLWTDRFNVWQASREALVIELPDAYAWDNDGGFEKEYDPESECSMSLVPKIDVIIAIEDAGVKVK